jgi:O-succinylbenzoic acid--CoA ligase
MDSMLTDSDARAERSLATASRHRSGCLALAAGGLRWDYPRLAAAAAERADCLVRAGLRPGQVVLCPAQPAVDLVLMQHALPRAGAALLPVAAGLDASRRQALIRSTGTEWVWQPDWESAVEPRADTGRLVRTGAGRGQSGPSEAAAQTDPPTLLVQTSGSGGAPRVAMLTDGGLRASATAINARLGLCAGDVWLGVLPRQHIGGLAIGWRCALAGAALVAHEGFDAAAVRAELMDEAAGITHLSLVPPMLARLLDAGAEPPPWLRVVLLGGQALDPVLARRALAGGWPLVLGYGMTETGSMIASGWVQDDGGVVMTPLPGVELDCPSCDPRTGTAMDASKVRGPQVERSAAVSRPLRLRGPMLMAGYADSRRQPGDGLSAGGWLATSDLGCRAPDGTLRVLGRADEVLVIGGVNVLPAEIERRLAAAPGIGEVAVAGVPEPVWGHRLVAVYTGAVDPAALDAWCRTNLPSVERPRGFRRVAGLPVLASGKLDRRALVRCIEEERK